MNSICVIGIYFGTLPYGFSLWLKSAESNPKIDFMIFTDCEISSDAENIKVHKSSLREIKELAEGKLGIDITLPRPFKCCDLRPAFGVIFKDYLSEYEYWGHCDFDLVFGDIYSFLESYEYKKYDKFLHLGHLSLYRNTEKVNEYFKLPGSTVGEWHEVFNDERPFCFDEMKGIGEIFAKNSLPRFTKRIFGDINWHHKRYTLSQRCYLDEKDKNYKHQIFWWENGKAYRGYIDKGELKTEEYIYIHYQKRPNYPVDFDVDKVNSFYLTNKGYIPKTGEPDKKTIQKLNHYSGALYENGEKLRDLFKMYFKQIKIILGIEK